MKCADCSREAPEMSTRCDKCRSSRAATRRRRYQKRKAAKSCVGCGVADAYPRCPKCKTKHNANQRAERKRKSWWRLSPITHEVDCKRCAKSFSYTITGGKRRRQFCNKCVKWKRPRKYAVEVELTCRECLIVFNALVFKGSTAPGYCTKTCRGRARYRKAEYGLTPEQWHQMLADQGNCCKICGDILGTGHDRHLDHCHESQEIRAILCSFCNVGLGNFREDPIRLESAIAYLAAFKQPL